MSRPLLTLECSSSELEDLWPAAIGLSLVTGTPFRMVPREGDAPLAPRASQLALGRAAAKLCDAPVGDALAFPADGLGRVALARELHLDVGALGICGAMSWLLPALSLAGGGTLHLRGATHPSRGPVAQTAALWWPTVLGAFGRRLSVKLERASFAPQTGGSLIARIGGADRPPPTLVELLRRGTLHEVHVTSLVGGSQPDRASRQLRGALATLRERGIHAEGGARPLRSDASGGGAVWIEAQFEHATATFSAVGYPGESGEETGARAATELLTFLESRGATDADSAAQLMWWGALLASGRLGASEPGNTTVQSPVATAQLHAIARAAESFLDVRASVDETGLCSVAPRPV